MCGLVCDITSKLYRGDNTIYCHVCLAYIRIGGAVNSLVAAEGDLTHDTGARRRSEETIVSVFKFFASWEVVVVPTLMIKIYPCALSW